MPVDPSKPVLPMGYDPSSAAAPSPADGPRVREIPNWLTALVIAGCIAGAGWFVYANWLQTSPSERIIILDRGPNDGIAASGGRHVVRAGNAWLAIREAGEGKLEFEFKFQKQDYLTPDQKDILTKVWRLNKDRAMAAHVQLTPAQAKQIAELRNAAAIEIPEADQAVLTTRFQAWKAEKDEKAKYDAEGKLLKAVDALAMKLEAPAKRSAAERAAQARAVLTPEQMRRFDEADETTQAQKPAPNRLRR